MQRFSRPRLIDNQDLQYRAFLKQIMLQKENQRATRPPSNRTLFGYEAESAIRDALAAQLPLSERRIVEYLEHRGRSAIKKYRELDAVHFADAKRVYVFEVKASSRASSLFRAERQLRETQAILKGLFAHVHIAIVLVDTGIPDAAMVMAIMAAPDAPHTPPLTIADVLAARSDITAADRAAPLAPDEQRIPLFTYSVNDIIALAGVENLHLSWDEDTFETDAAEDESGDASDTSSPTYTTADDDEGDDDNPLAAALRKALG